MELVCAIQTAIDRTILANRPLASRSVANRSLASRLQALELFSNPPKELAEAIRQQTATGTKSMSNNNTNPFWGGIRNALCNDLPFILDSAWRRREFEANRLFDYTIKPDQSGVEVTRRPDRRLPMFWLFIATLVFFTYGPTFDALCALFGVSCMPVFRIAVGVFLLLLALRQFFSGWTGGKARAAKRIEKEKIANTWRAYAIFIGVFVGIAVMAVPIVFLATYHFNHARDTGCVATASRPAVEQVVILVMAIVVAAIRGKRKLSSWRRVIEQTSLFAIVGAALLWIAPSHASEALQGPYPHVYGVFALALAIIACIAPAISCWQLESIPLDQAQQFRDSLCKVDLFPPRREENIEVTWLRAGSALLVGSLSHPMHLLLLPSLVTLMVPTDGMWGWFFGALVGSALLLMIGNLSSRWQQMVLHIRRWFLIGTPLAVSALVMVLAGLRLAQVQYASTVLDAAPFGVISTWVVMAYLLFWWFEYSVNGAVSISLLRVLGARNNEEIIDYPIDPQFAGEVKSTGRYLAPHGAGRFAIMGWFIHQDTKKPTAAFHSFELLALFSALTPPKGEDLLHDLYRRAQLYFLFMNALVLACTLSYLLYYGHDDAHNTVAAVVTTTMPPRNAQYSDLAKLLKEQKTNNRPAIIVAASGGGTRAALFTASALEGLAKLDATKDIVLMSGVSGGGVASAYFVAHQDELLHYSADAWTLYKNRMAEPFIRDVLDGAGEWRVVSAEPLGNLLAESFERRLFAQDQRIGTKTRPALILNTTIAGHPQEYSTMLHDMFVPPQSTDCDALHRPYSFLSGGRLIFTNLDSDAAFPNAASALADVQSPYVVVRDPSVSLARAAALNANFPPVFPNARVNVAVDDAKCPTRAYYVTDGGATENLGLVSALYALRAALATLPPESRPVIHIVAIEASATGYDYSQDRGLSAATGGAKERLVGALTQELLGDICGEPSCTGSNLQIHYLSMPLAFRSRGGFGTHWMFPASITIENPRLATMPTAWEKLSKLFARTPRDSVTIDKHELIQLWAGLHAPDASFCRQQFDTANQQVVAKWICASTDGVLPPDLHVPQWENVVDALHP